MSDSDDDGGWGRSYRDRSRSRSNSSKESDKGRYWGYGDNNSSKSGSKSPDSRRDPYNSNCYDDDEKEDEEDRGRFTYGEEKELNDSDPGGLANHWSRKSSNSSKDSRGGYRDGLYNTVHEKGEQEEREFTSWRCKRHDDRDSSSRSSTRSDRFGFRLRDRDEDSDEWRSGRRRKRHGDVCDNLEEERGRHHSEKLPCCCVLL